jgi:chemotaxis protein MotB
MLALLAHQLGEVPNNVSVEGHTDARAYADSDGYGNWELSADRANAARRLMQRTGLRSGQISQVRGFADRQLRVPGDPLDPSNRRISVIVHYLSQKPMQAEAQNESAPSASSHESAQIAPSSPTPESSQAAAPFTPPGVHSGPSSSLPAVAHVNASSMVGVLRARVGRVFGKTGM